jgi:hypothetical protein
MTKDEALRLALEALYGFIPYLPLEHDKPQCDRYDEAITAIKEALAESEPNYKKALEVWLDKTEWVQETVKPHELGMHRADVLKQRIEATLAQPEQDVGIIRYADISVGKIIHNSPPPQRTWVGLTDEDRFELAKAQHGWEDLCLAVEAKLKEKNT